MDYMLHLLWVLVPKGVNEEAIYGEVQFFPPRLGARKQRGAHLVGDL